MIVNQVFHNGFIVRKLKLNSELPYCDVAVILQLKIFLFKMKFGKQLKKSQQRGTETPHCSIKGLKIAVLNKTVEIKQFHSPFYSILFQHFIVPII